MLGSMLCCSVFEGRTGGRAGFVCVFSVHPDHMLFFLMAWHGMACFLPNKMSTPLPGSAFSLHFSLDGKPLEAHILGGTINSTSSIFKLLVVPLHEKKKGKEGERDRQGSII